MARGAAALPASAPAKTLRNQGLSGPDILQNTNAHQLNWRASDKLTDCRPYVS